MGIMDAVALHGMEIAPPQIRIRKPHRSDVNIHDPQELAMWCRRFGVTPLQLCSAIDRVGTDAQKVEVAIRSR